MLEPQAIVQFLNRLPITGSRDIWMDEFRAALLALFTDVDQIAININVFCDPLSDKIPSEHEISVRFSSNGVKDGVAVVPLEDISITEAFEAETGKFVPLEKYHSPKYFHYFHESGTYMGSMIFFRFKEHAPTSDSTFEFMESLAPFIKYVYAGILSMQNTSKPFVAAFRDAQCRMEADAGFSPQERKVMTMTLLGQPYKKIADELDISLNTVRSHVKSIHRKTKTHSYSELFAKYFIPVAGEL